MFVNQKNTIKADIASAAAAALRQSRDKGNV